MKESVTIKIVLDANWYVSACINNKSRRTLYYGILRNPRFKVYYSEDLLTEFLEVIERNKFRRYVTLAQAQRFKNIALKFLRKGVGGIVSSIARDSCDNYLLGLCETCNIRYLITGDEDLLVLQIHKDTSILSMSDFVDLMAQ